MYLFKRCQDSVSVRKKRTREVARKCSCVSDQLLKKQISQIAVSVVEVQFRNSSIMFLFICVGLYLYMITCFQLLNQHHRCGFNKFFCAIKEDIDKTFLFY